MYLEYKMKIKSYLELIRIKHYLKNILVFLPLVFSQKLTDLNLVYNTFLSFLVFSFSASIVYIFNDICDVNNDKKHPTKKNRPLAKGIISLIQAKIIFLALSFVTISLIIFLFYKTNNILTLFIPFIYIFLNILYSKKFKNFAIIDLLILTSGFILRVLYGAININVIVSQYLYLTIFFGSYYLSLGKRREEIKIKINSRPVLEEYNEDFLDKNMYVAYGLSIVSYMLWCMDKDVILKIGNTYLFWTIPILMVLFQLYSLNIEKGSYGDPIEIILSDKKILFIGLTYIVFMILIVYVL